MTFSVIDNIRNSLLSFVTHKKPCFFFSKTFNDLIGTKVVIFDGNSTCKISAE